MLKTLVNIIMEQCKNESEKDVYFFLSTKYINLKM